MGPDRLGRLYHFDPMDAATFDDVTRRARELALIVGFGGQEDVAGGGRWRCADPADELFGEPIPDEALADPDSCVQRGSTGLAKLDRDGDE
eukprot:52276-Lingulodinium_polyedra.AAC.1